MVAGQVTRNAQLDALTDTRHRTLALVSELGEPDLVRVVSPLLSPLIWDLGHIANFEQRWLLGGDQDGLDSVYDPFATPRAQRGELPFLNSDECFAYMDDVRAAAASRFDQLDPFLVELVIQHEQQHNETMLQLLRMSDGYRPPAALLRREQPAGAAVGAGWIDIPAGRYVIGSATEHVNQFIYDNEQDAHEVDLDAFAIARRPVTNGEFAEWIAAGGYEREQWWSAEGRSWLAAEPAETPLGWIRDGAGWAETGFGDPRPIDPDAPVVHVNWFEAEAYAVAHDARLPSETEWEVAASADPMTGERNRHPWGDDEWEDGVANLDQLAFGTVPAGTAGSPSASGCSDMAGQAWEWTSTEFHPYRGFEPFCYGEYSAPFFDSGGYRVLRGGSWATRPRTVDCRFRNWDHPQRRQIFSGFRLACDR
ncbi:MAG TPA: ergothioneine biosynthesis protein EgtB [Solirubrobacterales bacterium]|jgi:iron(II)-dependent oxidoreductase|nr:ergothioneine biosynthesis protein EgtB [Solirubrobacterales bacterium]